MHYTLHQLQIFLKISEKLSITKAAEELHLTQPAVSIQLKKFQEQFPYPLTEVIGRKIYITDFGKEIVEVGKEIINHVNLIDHKIASYKGKLTGKLKISIVSTAKYIMPYLLANFINKNPEIELVLDVTNKSKVVRSLEKNEVDFSMVSILPDKLQIKTVQLMENELYLVGNTATIFKKKKYDKSILSELPIIYREEGSGTRLTMEKYINKYNISIDKKMELTSNEAVKHAVLAGLGYSIMPLIGIRNEINDNKLQIIPVEGFPIKSNWNIIWLKDKKLSPVANAFLDYIAEEKERFLKSTKIEIQ